MQIRTVTEVTRHIKMLVESDEELVDLWVEGEVSNFHRASSGHCYFTLKDTQSEIRCVMWRGEVNRQLRLPSQGDSVVAHGYISIYERGGAYQFYVDALERGGVGAIWRAFQALKERLEAEGLFAAERKRPLPKWPRTIGVVTSPDGAAIRDILNVLRARYPLVQVVLSPSLAQGVDAPSSLVRAIERLNQREDIDVVIVARGGGSLEDLAAFNDERVARAVAASRAPVVSGIGHETDFTITDYVADLRAPTPSAAAAAVVPDVREFWVQIREMVRALVRLMGARLDRWRELLQGQVRWLRLHDPRGLLAEQRQRVDDLARRATLAVRHRIALGHTSLSGLQASLGALNPRVVLERGYAVVQDRVTGTTIKSVQQAALRQDLTIHVYDGRLGAQVTEV